MSPYQRIESSPSLDRIDNDMQNKDSLSLNSCSIQSIDIDEIINNTHADFNTQQNNSAVVPINDMVDFVSSWQDDTVVNDNDSRKLNKIQVIFTIPNIILNQSLIRKAVFITDVKHHQFLASLTDFCSNGSSFIIKYSTFKSLPHSICLYLLINVTSSTALHDIIFCRIIENLDNFTNFTYYDPIEIEHSMRPSAVFILSQCIIIFIMMFIIYVVQTVKKHNLINRIQQCFVRTRLYKIIFGRKTVISHDVNVGHASKTFTTTLREGLQPAASHHLSSLPNHQVISSHNDVLTGNELNATMNGRRATRVYLMTDMSAMKELKKRMSVYESASTDAESNS